MIQFDFLEISGSLTDFQTRKNMRILADSPQFCQKFHVFTLFLGHPPEKTTSWIPPKDVVADLLQLPQRDEQKRDDTSSPQVVSALCFCMDLRPVKSHPNLGGEVKLGEVSFASPSGHVRFVGWGDFFSFGAKKNGWVPPQKKRKGSRMVVTKQKGGGCGMWNVFGGFDFFRVYSLGWRGCWNFSKGLLLRSGEKFWAKMLGMPGRFVFFLGGPTESWLNNQRPGCGFFVAFSCQF